MSCTFTTEEIADHARRHLLELRQRAAPLHAWALAHPGHDRCLTHASTIEGLVQQTDGVLCLSTLAGSKGDHATADRIQTLVQAAAMDLILKASDARMASIATLTPSFVAGVLNGRTA